MFRTAGLIGVGLIGGSLGLAMKSGGLVERVIGFGRTQKNLDQAKQIGAIDEVVELATLCSQSDLIILSVPVAQTQAMLEQILPHLREQTVVIDVGSTKSDVIASAKAALGERVNQFVACHPIAGGAQHGALAARKDLFVDRQVMICPIPENRLDFISVIEEFWHRLGSLIFKMSALEHDHIFATVSHLPHLLPSYHSHADIPTTFAGCLVHSLMLIVLPLSLHELLYVQECLQYSFQRTPPLLFLNGH